MIPPDTHLTKDKCHWCTHGIGRARMPWSPQDHSRSIPDLFFEKYLKSEVHLKDSGLDENWASLVKDGLD